MPSIAMFDVALPSDTDFDAWRVMARRLRLADVPPEAVLWRVDDADQPLFAEPLPEPKPDAAFTAPRAFMDLARDLLLHRSPARLDLLYRLLWRLKAEPRLIEIVTDPDVDVALNMRKAVHQAIHKMHAFVRFRRLESVAEETYVAWFEPPHRVALAASNRFVQRMANLHFSILTPDVCVHWDRTAVTTTPGADRSAAPPEDASEEDWRTYFSSIFNPARLNPGLMAQHMPKRYWRNLPEAQVIADLVFNAQGRTEAMVQAEPTVPSHRAKRIAERTPAAETPDAEPQSLAAIAVALNPCRRCDLWRDATQAVPGEGPAGAALMLVGEQPGDQEDLAGHPFVGPAGEVLNRALAQAGAPREAFYVTNAVKHFKHEQRGKRRMHKTPNTSEVKACRWWLDHERRLVGPKVVVALGGTAAAAVLGRPVSVTKERGVAGTLADGATAFITVHPSYLLRIPDAEAKAAAYRDFVSDLKAAYALARAATTNRAQAHR